MHNFKGVMKHNRKWTMVGAVALFAVAGCVHDSLVPVPEPSEEVTELEPPCDPETVHFQQDVLPLIVSNCAQSGCHDAASAEDGIILESYAHLLFGDDDDLVVPGQPGESELLEVILDSDPDDRMPPPPAEPLSAEAIDIITAWIAQGALNLSCEEAGCDTTDYTWSGRILPLFETHCIGCHSGADPDGGLSLGEHSQAVTAVSYMSLLAHVQQLDGYSPMPPSGPALDSCKVAAIEGWIADGMPNN